MKLTQEYVDAWLLKGTQGLVEFLSDIELSPQMQEAVDDAIVEVKKAIELLDKGHHHLLPTPEAHLSRMLPLLIRGLMLRLTHSSAPMSNANLTSLHFLLEKLNEKSAHNKTGSQVAPKGGTDAPVQD